MKKILIILILALSLLINTRSYADERVDAEAYINKCHSLDIYFTDTDIKVGELIKANNYLVNALKMEHAYTYSLEQRIKRLELQINKNTDEIIIPEQKF